MVWRSIAFAGIGVLAGAVSAAGLFVTHPYGEVVDRGSVTIRIHASDGRLGCNPPTVVVREGHSVIIGARKLPQGAPTQMCFDMPSVDIGELSAGSWTIVLELYDAVGDGVVERAEHEIRVQVPGTTCNPDPTSDPTLIVLPTDGRGGALLGRLRSDPTLAARYGHPIDGSVQFIPPSNEYAVLRYPRLDNPFDKAALLRTSGDFLSVEVNIAFCIGVPPAARYGTVIEYYHAGLDHYFYTAKAGEIAVLDEGTRIRGWARTGQAFGVMVAPGCFGAVAERPAYRFYGRAGVGPSSHVFTVSREECRIVADSGAWLFEDVPFWARLADSGGACPSGTRVLYRVWRPLVETNHRFTTERHVVDEMTARGWVDEGAVMCVSGGGG